MSSAAFIKCLNNPGFNSLCFGTDKVTLEPSYLKTTWLPTCRCGTQPTLENALIATMPEITGSFDIKLPKLSHRLPWTKGLLYMT